MGFYIIATVAAVAFASFASFNKVMAEGIRPALGIIFLAALIAPIPELVAGLESIDISASYPEYEAGIAEDAAEAAFCRGICLAVADEFDLDADSVSVECIGFDLSLMRANTVRIELSGKAALADRIGIRNYIENEGFGKCEVVILFE